MTSHAPFHHLFRRRIPPFVTPALFHPQTGYNEAQGFHQLRAISCTEAQDFLLHPVTLTQNPVFFTTTPPTSVQPSPSPTPPSCSIFAAFRRTFRVAPSRSKTMQKVQVHLGPPFCFHAGPPFFISRQIPCPASNSFPQCSAPYNLFHATLLPQRSSYFFPESS